MKATGQFIRGTACAVPFALGAPLGKASPRSGPMNHRAQFEQWVPFPIERVFLFFANPGNLARIMPPHTGTELLRLKLVPPPGVAEERATITDRAPLAGAGSEIVTSISPGPLSSLSRPLDRPDHRVRVEPPLCRRAKEGTVQELSSSSRTHGRNAEPDKGNRGTRPDRIRRGIWMAGRSGTKAFRQSPVAADVRLSPESTGEADRCVGTGRSLS